MAPTTSSVVDRFRQVDVAGYPDVHLLESDLDVVLWVLLVASERLSIDRMTAAQVADVATFVEKRALSRQAVASLLLGAKGLVARAGRSTPDRKSVV